MTKNDGKKRRKSGQKRKILMPAIGAHIRYSATWTFDLRYTHHIKPSIPSDSLADC